MQMKESIRILTRQMRRCGKLLRSGDKSINGGIWVLRDDLAKASRALALKDVPEMNHMVAVLKGYGNREGG